MTVPLLDTFIVILQSDEQDDRILYLQSVYGLILYIDNEPFTMESVNSVYIYLTATL